MHEEYTDPEKPEWMKKLIRSAMIKDPEQQRVHDAVDYARDPDRTKRLNKITIRWNMLKEKAKKANEGIK